MPSQNINRTTADLAGGGGVCAAEPEGAARGAGVVGAAVDGAGAAGQGRLPRRAERQRVVPG